MTPGQDFSTSGQTTHSPEDSGWSARQRGEKCFQHLDFSSSCSEFAARPALESDLIPSWVRMAEAAWLSTMPCGLGGCCGFSMSARRRRKKPWRLNEWKSSGNKKSTTAVTVDGNVGRRTAGRTRDFGTTETRTALSQEASSGLGSRSSSWVPPASQPSKWKIKMRNSGAAARAEAVAWGWTSPSDGQMFPRIQIHLKPQPRLLSLQSDQLRVNWSHCLCQLPWIF